jgi:choline dehydrogenase-like flavoprotein
MRIPGAVALYKQALGLNFTGLAIGDDLSNRTSVASATTLYTIWHDPMTGKNRRSSAADALLWAPNQQRARLTVLATHKVDRVLFDRDVTATGVSFLPTTGSVPSSKRFKAYAARGIILSAGSLATAPILERPGISRLDILKSVRVRKIVDLPGIGANLNVGP